MLLYEALDPPEVLCVEINITDDDYLETNEYFYLQLNSSDLDVEFKIDHSIVKIQDDDSKLADQCTLRSLLDSVNYSYYLSVALSLA